LALWRAKLPSFFVESIWWAKVYLAYILGILQTNQTLPKNIGYLSLFFGSVSQVLNHFSILHCKLRMAVVLDLNR
jgi:hypothetical protein